MGWCSRNAAGRVASHTVNTSLYIIFERISWVVSSQVYVSSDAPFCAYITVPLGLSNIFILIQIDEAIAT